MQLKTANCSFCSCHCFGKTGPLSTWHGCNETSATQLNTQLSVCAVKGWFCSVRVRPSVITRVHLMLSEHGRVGGKSHAAEHPAESWSEAWPASRWGFSYLRRLWTNISEQCCKFPTCLQWSVLEANSVFHVAKLTAFNFFPSQQLSALFQKLFAGHFRRIWFVEENKGHRKQEPSLAILHWNGLLQLLCTQHDSQKCVRKPRMVKSSQDLCFFTQFQCTSTFLTHFVVDASSPEFLSACTRPGKISVQSFVKPDHCWKAVLHLEVIACVPMSRKK